MLIDPLGVFERAATKALLMADDNQAVSFACMQLECMYQFATQKEVKEMCTLAAKKFYDNPRFRGNDHVLRIFQVLIKVSRNMGAEGIYKNIEAGGHFRNSLKFHVLWGEAIAAKKNKDEFKAIWALARERLPSKSNVDMTFREIASTEFPEVPTWFDDEDQDKTLNIFARPTKSRRRSSAAILAPSTTSATLTTAPSASKESFAIFIDDENEKEEEEERVAAPPRVAARPRGLSTRNPNLRIATFDDDPFDDNEPTVAGNQEGKASQFLASTPLPTGEGNFEWFLSPISHSNSPFVRKRKTFETRAVGVGVAGDKARSSIGPKGQQTAEKETGIVKEMIGMKIRDDNVNPWDRKVRESIMASFSIPTNRHDLEGTIKQPRNGQKMELGGEIYSLEHMIGEGGFAKVFLCTNEKKELLAMKYETPSCEWEVHILEALRKRVGDKSVLHSLMQVTDAFIYQNCSLILSEYLPLGTLLQSTTANTDPHWSIVVYLGMQMARVLKDVHAAGIVHADAKPDNWMVTEKIDEDADIEKLIDARPLRLIDWGRAIDMKTLGGISLYGKAGTDKFDCIEMCDGRAWTYHPDFYAFCATIYMLHMKDYMSVTKGANGRYGPVKTFKRRHPYVSLWTEIFDDCLNIPDASSLPNWTLIYEKLKSYFIDNVEKSAWKDAVSITGEELTIRSVLVWLKETLLNKCDRIDLLLEGETVRPGVLVLVNDTDWELLDEERTLLKNGDRVTFISTLHGG